MAPIKTYKCKDLVIEQKSMTTKTVFQFISAGASIVAFIVLYCMTGKPQGAQTVLILSFIFGCMMSVASEFFGELLLCVEEDTNEIFRGFSTAGFLTALVVLTKLLIDESITFDTSGIVVLMFGTIAAFSRISAGVITTKELLKKWFPNAIKA